jgi:hypothetical protein
MNGASAANRARSDGSYRIRPAFQRSRILVPEHQQLSNLRLIPAEHQHEQLEKLVHQQVPDSQIHPGQPTITASGLQQIQRVKPTIEYPGGTGCDNRHSIASSSQ